MPTLDAQSGLDDVARILRGAASVGRARWRHDTPEGATMTTNPGADFSADLARLFSLLNQRGINYLLVGGVALLRYVDGRNTEDIDLLLSLESLREIPEIRVHDQNAHFARGVFGAIRIDALLTTNPLFKLVAERYATVHAFGEIDVNLATVDGLLVLKFYALPALYREGDWQRVALYEADITMLCQRHQRDLRPALETVRPFVDAGEFQELEKIAADIGRRVDRNAAARRMSDQPPTFTSV